MSKLAEINAQIAELTRQAEEIKSQEKQGVIAELKEKIALYSLSARDLGLDISSPPLRGGRASEEKRAKAEPKYRDEHGNTWSGGRGRKPAWVLKVENEGGNIEDYRIAP
jgi:DNA-binding protein H-NS